MDGHAAHASARIVFRVLGPLEVADSDGRPINVGGGKPATLLTLLLLQRNAWIGTDQLIDAVWAGRAVPASAQRNLKTYVWQLRRALPGWPDGLRVESRPGAYRIRVAPGELDADVAADLSVKARTLLGEGAAAEAETLVHYALGLWRGRPYDGLTGSAVDRLVELHRCLQEDLADAQLALGRTADAITVMRALTEEEPLRELAWTKLMSALHRTGRRHDALAAYQRARTTLVRELGVEPGPQLTTLHQEILRGSQPADRAVRSDLPCRVAGFVGRADELDAVVAASRASAPVPVVSIDGMPGIGKTALALEVAHALADTYPDGQLYLNLHTHTGTAINTIDALRKLIRAVGGEGAPLPGAEDELAALWRSELRGQRILLLLDDVANAEQVRQLLPGATGSLVLVTSRARLTGLDRAACVSLDVLPDEDACRLVSEGVAEVLHWCAGHPAALRLMAERLRDRPAWTAARMVARLADRGCRHRELAAVLALFERSYRALPEPVQRLYRLLGLMPRFDVRRAARLVGTTQEEVEPMLDLLADLHLVSEPAPGRFALHPLVEDHAYAALLATETETELVAAATLVRHGSTGRADLELVAPDGPRVA